MNLPPPEKTRLKIGYMRLSDSAPMIVAYEHGLFADQGLDVELLREVSWANLRDRLVVGDLDAAQLLSPLPMMTSYGVGGLRSNLLTGLVLSLNGNAITVSTSLWNALNDSSQELRHDSSGSCAIPGMPDTLQMSRRLKQLLAASGGNLNLTFATVHLYSMHTLQLRLWLQSGGIDPDQHVRIIVLPPEQMCDNLARGLIDGYCVGEPWNTLAVQQGLGSIVTTGYQIWNNAPEKVLAVTEPWHRQHPGTHARLRIALMQACAQLADPEARISVIPTLAQSCYLDLPEQVLLPSLSGKLLFHKRQAAVSFPDFHVFSRHQAGFPWRSSAETMMQQCSEVLGKVIADETITRICEQCYRPDLYRETARYLSLDAPPSDSRDEGKHAVGWEMQT